MGSRDMGIPARARPARRSLSDATIRGRGVVARTGDLSLRSRMGSGDDASRPRPETQVRSWPSIRLGAARPLVPRSARRARTDPRGRDLVIWAIIGALALLEVAITIGVARRLAQRHTRWLARDRFCARDKLDHFAYAIATTLVLYV